MSDRVEHGPSEKVYCASERAIARATVAYRLDSGANADPVGLAGALIATHDPALGLDRSVCLRDVVEKLRAEMNRLEDSGQLGSTVAGALSGAISLIQRTFTERGPSRDS